ncbi:TolB family protein [Bacteroidota bacterium]
MKRYLISYFVFLLQLVLIMSVSCTSTESEGPNLPAWTGEYLGQTPPGTAPQSFAPGFFASFTELHSTAVFSPDGREVFFTPMDGIPWEIMHSKIEDGVWTTPDYASFNSEFGCGDPSFSPDGTRIFFLSWASASGNSEGNKENIWYVDRDGDGWGDPQILGNEVNRFIVHWLVSSASNGRLYFAGRLTEEDDRDIYYSDFINGQYTDAQIMSTSVNSDDNEDTPFIAPDESYIIFGRGGGPSSYADLYISFRSTDNSWTQAVSMDNVNTASHELYPIVSGNGEYFFFMSMRDGVSRPYWMDAGIIESLR